MRPTVLAASSLLSLLVHGAVAATLIAPHRPRPREEAPAEASPQQSLVGDTFALPVPDSVTDEPSEAPGAGEAHAPSSPEPRAAPAPPPRSGPGAPAPPSRPLRPASSSAAGSEPGSGDGSPGAVYGAAGDRSAADLATAFTRGFPQAASADPSWLEAPFGDAGELEVQLTLDEGGKLTATHVGQGGTAPLRAGVARTLALIGGRSFTSRGKVTRLHLVATVSRDTVHDGLHGDVFAVGGSYAGREGQAFFALAVGRRIDLRIRPR